MNDSQAFYQARMPVLENFIKQRNKSRGYTAALSAPVRIFPHQLNVLARVLGDPVRRFVLADEVGLGKTIEAGLIIRQLFLDNPNTYVIVAVPRPLCNQWIEELKTKLLLNDQFELGTLEVVTHDDIPNLGTANLDMLVIDEAHQLAIGAGNKPLNPAIQTVASQIPGLLLLTATPLRGNAVTFYHLLQLIDPVVYTEDGYENFAQRMAQREDEADNLELLTPETDQSLLNDVLEDLKELYLEDIYLNNLLESALKENLNKGSEIDEKLRLVRDYVRETYRLSRRVIRNRRSEAIKKGFRISGRSFEVINLEEPTRYLIDDFLEKWRLDLQADNEDNTGEILYRKGLEHALAGPEVFLTFVSEQINQSQRYKAQFEQVGAAIRIALADQEHGLSKRWEHVLRSCEEVYGKMKNRCVIFTSFASSADQFVELLQKRIGPHAVAHHLVSDSPEEQDAAVQQFLEGGSCRVLVCDESAEEGRNLQNSESIFHLDLPLSANRLEQRIGRTDRFREAGTSTAISFVFNEARSDLVDGQLKLFSDAVGIFDESVATLHHPLSEIENQIQGTAFSEGAAAFDLDLAEIKKNLDAEKELIEYLEFLESSSSYSDMSPSDIYDFEDFEESWGEVQESLELLVGENGGLNLKPIQSQKTPGIFTYNPLGKRARTLPLVRLDHFLEIAHEFPHERTFNRVIARKISGNSFDAFRGSINELDREILTHR